MAKNDLFIRHAYSPRVRVAVEFNGPGRTKQSFKDECDINRIMSRYASTGVLDFIEKREARFADVSETDFLSAMQTVAEAQSAFNLLPSDLRLRFENEPSRLLAFLDDPKNLQEAIDLGLVNKPLVTAGEVPGAVGAAGTEAPVEAAKAA